MKKIFVHFLFQKKCSKHLWKKHIWLKKFPGDFSILNEKNLYRVFICSKNFWKKMNWEISIQNGDFSILNGENSMLRLKKKVPKTSETKWMEKSPFRMEISPFWMANIIRGVSFYKKKVKFKTLLKKMKGLISIQNGDFSNLNGEDYLWNLFFIKTKFKTRLKKNEWRNIHSESRMEISPSWNGYVFFCLKFFFSNKVPKTFGKMNGENAYVYRFFFQTQFQKLLKQNEWINLHSEWRFLHSEWRKFSVEIF